MKETHLITAPIVPDNGTDFRVVWSYVDQFGLDQRQTVGGFPSVDEAQHYASLAFVEETPDAWWIEEVTTVEYHNTFDEQQEG